jgi:integrase
VFATSKGHRESESNVRRRIVEPAVERADAQLLAEGRRPMPSGVTPHSLRRPYISILLAAGADVRYVMGQVAHTDPGLTLRIYAQVIGSDREHGGEVDRLVSASHRAQMGTTAVVDDANGVGTVVVENEKDPH